MLISDPAFYAVAVPAVLLVGISKIFMPPLKLAPLRYSATMAVFFAAINAAKWLPYAWLGLIDATNMTTAAALLPAAPLGVWLGLRVGRRISPSRVYLMVELGLLLTGCKLLWDGLKPWLR